MKNSLENRRFKAYYQPKYDFKLKNRGRGFSKMGSSSVWMIVPEYL